MKEQISALVDGELSQEACEKLLNRCKQDEALRSDWATYQLIGDAMRETSMLSKGFEQRVMAAIDAEPTVLAPHQQSTSKAIQSSLVKEEPNRWYLSMAASVAAVFFVGWIVLQGQAPSQVNPLESVAVAQVNATAPVSPMLKDNINNPTLANAAVAKEGQAETATIPADYLLAHQSYAPSGVSSYIQTASYSESAE